MIGIGIDTGGTYTDAVIYDMDAKKVLSSGKSLTTKNNLEIGISNALDLLDQKYLPQVEMMALSTTLATNAALEDKGSRARLLMIGMEPDKMNNVDTVYAGYGFHDLGQIHFIDGKPENFYQNPEEPDWAQLKKDMPEVFGDCQAVGICQIYPNADGGKLEKKAREKMWEERPDLSVTLAHDMFDEVDPLKRGAGAMLNAKLVPLIAEFLQAVRHVMKARGINAKIAIVRSDGSLMTEKMAREYPVETLLCGPAASVVGGQLLSGEDDCVIVDMGGTTTDVAIVRGGKPLTADKGVTIGKWKTTVQGLFIDTFLLGGDSAVRYKNAELFLDEGRVIPLCMLYKQYPEILGRLQAVAERYQTHTRMMHEFYVLMKDVSESPDFSEQERKICKALKNGPLMMDELSHETGIDMYYIRTDRLEREGIVLKSGLTSTDMMVIKGDFTDYQPEAPLAALVFVAQNTGLSVDEIPDLVYKMAEERLYCNLVRILLNQKYPARERILESAEMDQFIKWMFKDAISGKKNEWMTSFVKTDLPIVGVGGPIHIFLPKVAELLGTTCIIREHSPVANAMGAIAGRIITNVKVHIKAEYKNALLVGYSVFEGTQRHIFKEYPDAEEFGKKLAMDLLLERCALQGASKNPNVSITIEKDKNLIPEEKRHGSSEEQYVLFEGLIIATATDDFQL